MLNNKTVLKLISLFMAIGLWVMVISGQVETVSLTVPVKLINFAKGQVAVSEYSNVSITVKGAAKLINTLENSDILLNVDVSSFPTGQSVRRLLPADFKTPLGIEVVDVQPSEVKITVDYVESKEVPVIASVIGEVKRGFIAENISLKPNTVTVRGAKSIINQIESVSTIPINMSDRSESFALAASVKEYEGIQSIKPEYIEVKVKLRENIVTKDFKDMPVECMDLKENLKMKERPKLNVITVKGREDMIERFEKDVTFLTDCRNITKTGVYSGRVAYKTELLIDITRLEPQKITFEIVE